jgi:hypothetical protein
VTGRRACAILAIALAIAIGIVPRVSHAQTTPPPARTAAPIDLTGYWVAFVTEDWRFRMLVPPRGDYRGVPLNAQGRRVADAWDPIADATPGNQCKPYGAAAIMRVPGRLHVTWQDDNTLRMDTDAGTQTRVFRFAPAVPPVATKSWQGESTARWDQPNRALTVTTKNVLPGYLRRNGVPYSENARVTEYFDIAPTPGNGQLLVVTTVVDDPTYLVRRFIVSSHFKKERDGSKWSPIPCSARW